MTRIDKIMKQICTVPNVSELIYPPICGICGKLNSNSLCNKCEIEIKKQEETNILNQGEEVENKYFNELNKR